MEARGCNGDRPFTRHDTLAGEWPVEETITSGTGRGRPDVSTGEPDPRGQVQRPDKIYLPKTYTARQWALAPANYVIPRLTFRLFVLEIVSGSIAMRPYVDIYVLSGAMEW